MSTDISETPTVVKPVKDWMEALRDMELDCARSWAESAKYWRAEAARYLVADNPSMAAEALLNAVVRETYLHEDLEKARDWERRRQGACGMRAEPGSGIRTVAA